MCGAVHASFDGHADVMSREAIQVPPTPIVFFIGRMGMITLTHRNCH